MAIANPAATTTQKGGLCTLIGLDTQVVYSALPAGFAANTTITQYHIGGATSNVEDPRYSGKALRFQTAVGAVANGAVVANTYLNQTGAALVSGNVVLAIAP